MNIHDDLRELNKKILIDSIVALAVLAGVFLIALSLSGCQTIFVSPFSKPPITPRFTTEQNLGPPIDDTEQNTLKKTHAVNSER
jgi:hypothetical protein